MTDSTNFAKNLARMNAGAKIEAVSGAGKEAAGVLVMEDGTISCPLQQGETNFVVSLAKVSMLDRLTFINENAAARGELKIAVSNRRLPADSNLWQDVEGTVPFSEKRMFNLSLVGVEAKYVRLSFRVDQAGSVAGLGLYGSRSLREFSERFEQPLTMAYAAPARSAKDQLNFNFANLYARARVVYVSSGALPAGVRMIDDDVMTAFRFAPADRHPTVILELSESERLNRVSAIYAMESGELSVYLLDKLPENPANLSGLRPTATTVDRKAHGKAAVDFHPQGARFVLLRWTRDAAAEASQGFEIAEVHAFGNVPFAYLDQDGAPELFAAQAPRGGWDFGNPLGVPSVPVVSP